MYIWEDIFIVYEAISWPNSQSCSSVLHDFFPNMDNSVRKLSMQQALKPISALWWEFLYGIYTVHVYFSHFHFGFLLGLHWFYKIYLLLHTVFNRDSKILYGSPNTGCEDNSPLYCFLPSNCCFMHLFKCLFSAFHLWLSQWLRE